MAAIEERQPFLMKISYTYEHPAHAKKYTYHISILKIFLITEHLRCNSAYSGMTLSVCQMSKHDFFSFSLSTLFEHLIINNLATLTRDRPCL